MARDKLLDTEIKDFEEDTGFNIEMIPNETLFHDRYILIDRNTNNIVIYLCGSSSKNTGNSITTIVKLDYPDLYIPVIEK